jgi:hypothetical protein
MQELEKLQYEQALSTLREQYSMLIKITSLFFTADLALVGFAFQSKSPYMLIVAFIIPITIFAATVEMRRHMHPFVYFCAYMESKHSIHPGIMTTYISSAFSKRAFDSMKKFIAESNNDIEKNIKLSSKATTRDFLFKFCLPYYGSFFILQVSLAIFGFIMLRNA